MAYIAQNKCNLEEELPDNEKWRHASD